MSPRAAAIIWWVLIVIHVVTSAVGVMLFVFDPTVARLGPLVLWALVGGRLIYYELRYARTMATMLKDRQKA